MHYWSLNWTLIIPQINTGSKFSDDYCFTTSTKYPGWVLCKESTQAMCNVNCGPGQELWQLSRVITMGLFQAHGPKKWAKYVNRTVGILLPVNQQVTICLKKSFENHKKIEKLLVKWKNCTVQFQSLLNIQRLKMQILIKWTFAFYLPKCCFPIPEAYRHMNVHLLYATEMTILKCLFYVWQSIFCFEKKKTS